MTTLYIMGHCLQPLAQEKVSLYRICMSLNRIVVLRVINFIKRMGGGTMRF
ncbi:MAG TPA: hypothetical protein VG984_03950 [Candidatus Paceibacterota bacterium]|nr:hypothetical protein [Candidatus Paceibacterota bacterium]